MEEGSVSHPSWCLSFLFFCFCVLFQIQASRWGRKRRRISSSPFLVTICSFQIRVSVATTPPFTSFKHCYSFHFFLTTTAYFAHVKVLDLRTQNSNEKKVTNCEFNLPQLLICKRYRSSVAVSAADSSRAGRTALLCLV